MTIIFLQILKMSMLASYVVLAILLIRLLLKKAPKKYSYALWSVVAFRLACPFTINSGFSLFNLPFLNKGDNVIALSGTPVVPSAGTNAVAGTGTAGIPIVSGEAATQEMTAVQSTVNPLDIVVMIWIIGATVLLTYGIITYIRMKRKMEMSMPLTDNIRQAYVRTPFILGLLKPTIYIPFDLDPEVEKIAVSHERCHIRRGDHFIKLLSFALLSIHWFNPLCWLAYFAMEKDMEMSCDEYVLSHYDNAHKSYSLALLSFSTGKRFSLASPLAFGENNVKERVVNAMKFKNVSKLITTFAIILCLLTFVACGTNGETATSTDANADTVSDADAAETVKKPSQPDPSLNYHFDMNPSEEAVSEDEETAAETPQEEPAWEEETETTDEDASQETTEEPAAEVSNEEAEADSEFKFEVSPIQVEAPITKGFGSSNGKLHPGIDIAAETETPVYAVADGTVTLSEWYGGFGNCVMIEHANGWTTFYAHCDTLTVSEGASVKAGEQIATVGNTGVATGPHLHLEVRSPEEEYVDPAPYL